MNKSDTFYDCIAELVHAGIRYAVVGNVESYPQHIGSDVDIMIYPEDIRRFHDAIWNLETPERKVVQMFQHEITAFYYILAFKSDSGTDFLQPDVCTDYYRNGTKLLSAAESLKETVDAMDETGKSKGFRILRPSREFIYYLLKKIDKGKISRDQFAHIAGCFLKDADGCRDGMGRFWRAETCGKIEKCFREGDVTGFQASIPSFRNEIHRGLKFGLVDRIKNSFRKIRRCIYPTGFIISFDADLLGRDEVVGRVVDVLSPAFRRTWIISDRISRLKTCMAKIKSTLIAGEFSVGYDLRISTEIGESAADRKTIYVAKDSGKDLLVSLIVDEAVKRLAARAAARHRSK